MEIILSRHGNTFEPGEPIVWAGATNDLPLARAGIRQAERLAEVLIAQKIRPSLVYCSALQRTVRYAQILIQKLGLPFQPRIDSRIQEIDYGEWTGLTNQEVIQKFGKEAVLNWDQKSLWPPKDQGHWGGSEEQTVTEVQSFVSDLQARHTGNETVVVISSNGRLRYFLTLEKGKFEEKVKNGSFKVKTGNVCKLTGDQNQFTIPYWDVEPVGTFKL